MSEIPKTELKPTISRRITNRRGYLGLINAEEAAPPFTFVCFVVAIAVEVEVVAAERDDFFVVVGGEDETAEDEDFSGEGKARILILILLSDPDFTFFLPSSCCLCC